MNYEHIETFLSIISNGTISAAANALHISQSTVSARINQLEDEIGVPLLYRSKGQRVVELTSYGISFIQIANQWDSLWKDTQNLKNRSMLQSLTVASVDAVNNYTFLPFYHYYIEKYNNVRLTINTHHSNEIQRLVENRSADIGFVFSGGNHPEVISKPIYRELMYLICHADSSYHDDILCEELNPENEVYLHWGPDYEAWHDAHWGHGCYSLLNVNTGSTLQHYLNKPGRWAVAPMSVVHEFSHNSNLTYYSFHTPPMPRICYMLTNRYPNPRRKELIHDFEKELMLSIEENDDICTFESWMLYDDGNTKPVNVTGKGNKIYF